MASSEKVQEVKKLNHNEKKSYITPRVTGSTTINRNEWNFPIRYLKSFKNNFRREVE